MTTEFSPKYSQALVVVDLDWYHALLRQYCKFLYLSKVQFHDVFENGNEQNACEVHEGPFLLNRHVKLLSYSVFEDFIFLLRNKYGSNTSMQSS